jgi:hypothetical protein
MSDINIDRHFRPKDLIPDAVFIPAGTELSAEDKQKFEGVRNWADHRTEELCRACGWDSYHELTSSYLPRLRIFRARLNSGLWVMGNDYAIWDRAGEKDMNNDYMTHQFLKEKRLKDIPILEEMHQYGKPSDPYHFVVMSQAKGAPLINVWPTASLEEKKGYADQLIAAIRELRQYTAPYPQRVDGGPLWDNILPHCNVRKACKNIGKTTEDWFNNMDDELRRGLGRQYNTTDDARINEKLKDLKKNFPDGAPYILTHGDLHCGNIIVNKGKIQAIIDWELAGYYPVWMERWAQSRRCQSDGCIELYRMVWGELEPQQDAKQFKEKVWGPIGEVEKVWKYCPITHTEADNVWRRPKWCECKPLGGLLMRHADAELNHEIDYSETARATYNPENYTEEEIAEELRLLSM